mgnify:FL=1
MLTEIGADEVPCIQVLNKIDCVEGMQPRIDRHEDGSPARVWVSAKAGLGLDLLLEAVSECLGKDVIQTWLSLAPEQGRLRARLYARGAVISERTEDTGKLMLQVKMPRNDYERLLAEDALHQDA